MSAELLTYTLSDGVATIALDDGKANALGYPMIEALSAALKRAESEARVVVLLGRPGKFCAGFDLKVMQRGLTDAADLLHVGGELYVQMLRSPLPIISACTGHAVAGGALLLLASDYSVGVEGEFKIGLNEVHIGLPLPILAIELARHNLDPRRLNEATCFGRLYTPTEAARVGYLNEACAPAEVETRVHAHATLMAQVRGGAFGESKRRLRGALADHIEATLKSDLDAFRVLSSGPIG